MGLAAGQVLQDRYKVVRIIKSGGFGSVYEGIDTKLADSPCAIKEILEEARTGQDGAYVTARFYEEMKALSKLDHPAIPKVRDYLTVDATAYIVMDLIQGRSLLEEVMESQVPLDPELVAQDMIALLDALTYLHNQDPPIIHRDIKPANVLRDRRSGTIKLVDFGLARQVQGPKTQTMVGTLGYSAPEQMMGKAERRSDLYSVGVTMEHLLTGKIPGPQLLKGHKPDLPEVRPGLVEIIDRSTQPRMDDRFSTAQQMSEALKAWLNKSGPIAPPPNPPRQTEMVTASPAHNGADWLSKVGAVAALLAALAIGMVLGRRSEPTPTQAPPPVAAVTPAVAVSAPAPAPVPEVTATMPTLPAPGPAPAPAPAPVVVPVATPSLEPVNPYPAASADKSRLKAYLYDVSQEMNSLRGLDREARDVLVKTSSHQMPLPDASLQVESIMTRLRDSQGRFQRLKAPPRARELEAEINANYANWLSILSEARDVYREVQQAKERAGGRRLPPAFVRQFQEHTRSLVQEIQSAVADLENTRRTLGKLSAEMQ